MIRTLTVPEVARLTGRNPEVIRRLVREGRLPAVRDESGTYRVQLEDLGVLLDLRRGPAVA